jgi:hypothetical protein
MTYRASPTRRQRRTKKAIADLKLAMIDIIWAEKPMTVRQVFYQMVSRGYIDKTESEYDNVVGRLLVKMRRDGDIPFDWLADSTRWMRKPTTFSSAEQALQATARHYRRAIWRDVPEYVEVWLEKEALAGVLVDVTDEYDVPLMVTRGYPSISFTYAAARSIAAQGKPATIYYFGDHDPSGVDISRKVESDLREFAPEADIVFERVAVEPWQIEAWSLPTRPTKGTDTRARNFVGESVEVDAIPPDELRRLAADCILDHIDDAALQTVRIAEASEREILANIAATMGHAA